MTVEEWKKAEEATDSVYRSARMRIDGHEVTLMRQRVSTTRLALAVYVDGKFAAKWIDAKEPYPEQAYLQKKTRGMKMTAKQKLELAKMTKKQQKAVEELREQYKYEYYDYCWTSFGAFKRHILANCNEIELIEA